MFFFVLVYTNILHIFFSCEVQVCLRVRVIVEQARAAMCIVKC